MRDKIPFESEILFTIGRDITVLIPIDKIVEELKEKIYSHSEAKKNIEYEVITTSQYNDYHVRNLIAIIFIPVAYKD